MQFFSAFTLLVVAKSALASLADFALQKVLDEAAPVFGNYDHNKINGNSTTAEWMKAFPDDTLLVHMNIPGAHDVQTWNYTQDIQDALHGITDLAEETPYAPSVYQCQQKSVVDMLEAGLRAFDLRYAFDVTNSSLVYWHSGALMSQTATVQDTLYGFYQWLDDHPSEALLLSFQYEGSTTKYAANDAAVQRALFDALTNDVAKQYFLQTKDRFGTLGEARGKITLLRRFDLDQLDASYTDALPGIHFSPNSWTDNGADITLVYNSATNATAHIEDNYGIEASTDNGFAPSIELKYNTTTANLLRAADRSLHPDDLYWSFASSNNEDHLPIATPRIMALGNGTTNTPLGGVNQQLVPFFKKMHGKRLGIVMFDFFDTPGDLIDEFLAIRPACKRKN